MTSLFPPHWHQSLALGYWSVDERPPGLQPDYALWRDFPYEYEYERLAIDLINGTELLREWVDDPAALPGDLEALAVPDETAWIEESREFLLYA